VDIILNESRLGVARCYRSIFAWLGNTVFCHFAFCLCYLPIYLPRWRIPVIIFLVAIT